ncbi:hypothetical protein COB11_07805 [Candidatus Aerophobetes bacterium]|uniref:Uncharacterized protein n=1 Tax=Aerophobetes bacterium TaxID=2030807 RepID=A0A2A4YBH1_UNCAE|nr:MAG: hypothetical protein COB11_07805 [Candidatus Aerophobetes bacterium]
MNINNYTSYFHDGSLIDINHDNTTIILSMESAEISSEENQDNISLSEHNTIKGKLHIEGINSIFEGDELISIHLRMLYDSAGILHFKIHATTVQLDIEWVNYPPHPEITAYAFYHIKGKKIWWENIPDLYDPFW